MCGDSAKEVDLNELMGDKLVNSLVTDPPYGVDYVAKNDFLNSIDKGNRNQTEYANDTREDYEAWFTEWLSNIKFTQYNTCYIFMSSQRLKDLLSAFEKAKLKMSMILVWAKNNHALSRTDYQPKHEFCVYGWKDRHKFYGGASRMSVLDYDKPLSNDLHPTMKPVGLIAQLIKDGSEENGIILDLFGGSGTTLVASEQTNRICYTMELMPDFVDVIRKRWAKLVYPETWEEQWQSLTPQIKQ